MRFFSSLNRFSPFWVFIPFFKDYLSKIYLSFLKFYSLSHFIPLSGTSQLRFSIFVRYFFLIFCRRDLLAVICHNSTFISFKSKKKHILNIFLKRLEIYVCVNAYHTFKIKTSMVINMPVWMYYYYYYSLVWESIRSVFSNIIWYFLNYVFVLSWLYIQHNFPGNFCKVYLTFAYLRRKYLTTTEAEAQYLSVIYLSSYFKMKGYNLLKIV